MRKISLSLVDSVIRKARDSSKHRAIHRFHELSDHLHRMINAMQPDSYVRPHRHANPDKVEAFVILRGQIAVIEFDDEGGVLDFCVLDKDGETQGAEIPPRTWHSLVCLEQDSAVYEVIQGPYEEDTHKKFPAWAPPEDQREEGEEFVARLKQFILRNRSTNR